MSAAATRKDRERRIASHCDIVETTELEMLNRTALATVRVGDVLHIELRSGAPPLLVAMAKTGSAVGAINTGTFRQIVECIRFGHEYVAQVLVLKGALCRVRIRPRRRRRS